MKYKPAHVARLHEQAQDEHNARAARLKEQAAHTIAQTRELLKQSQELLERSRTWTVGNQETPASLQGKHHQK